MKDNKAIAPKRAENSNKIAQRISILMVEDNPDHATLAKVALEKNRAWSIDVATNLAAAFSAIRTNDYQVLLVDYCLPDGDGLDLLDWVDPGCAVILMTSQGSEQLAVDALKYGALDYIVKDALFREVITDAVQNALDRTAGRRQTPSPTSSEQPPRAMPPLTVPPRTASAPNSATDTSHAVIIRHNQCIRESILRLRNDKVEELTARQIRVLQDILDHCDAISRLLTGK